MGCNNKDGDGEMDNDVDNDCDGVMDDDVRRYGRQRQQDSMRAVVLSQGFIHIHMHIHII
jgi:hypothetical protein